MKQRRRRNSVMIGVLSLGLLAGVALTAHPAQAVDAVGPNYADPAWDQSLPVATRFVVLTNWSSAAVLDKETGLVWERTPVTTTNTWSDARTHCAQTIIGHRLGWRLPSVHELASLIDPSVAPPGPALPPGHPFLNVQSASYWSATTDAGNPPLAWLVFFNNGDVSINGKDPNVFSFQVWCVRGSMNADQY